MLGDWKNIEVNGLEEPIFFLENGRWRFEFIEDKDGLGFLLKFCVNNKK